MVMMIMVERMTIRLQMMMMMKVCLDNIRRGPDLPTWMTFIWTSCGLCS